MFIQHRVYIRLDNYLIATKIDIFIVINISILLANSMFKRFFEFMKRTSTSERYQTTIEKYNNFSINYFRKQKGYKTKIGILNTKCCYC